MKSKQSFEDAVLKTVMWWSDKAFRTPNNQNNGDDSPSGGMSFILMNLVSITAQRDVTEDRIKKFEECLSKYLEEYRATYPTARIWLHVDYYPCRGLQDAAIEAGLPTQCFPCKSSTYITADNRVMTSYQYGGATIEV